MEKVKMMPIDAVRIALQKEKETLEFYLNLYKDIEDTGTKEMLKFLAQEEVKHVKLLEEELDKEPYKEM